MKGVEGGMEKEAVEGKMEKEGVEEGKKNMRCRR